VSPEAGVVAVDLPPDWFEQAQRAVTALRSRLEHAEREIARREQDLELRGRRLDDRESGLAEARGSVDAESLDLAAKARAAQEEAARLAEQREAALRESESLAATRRELDAAREALGAREDALRTLERDLEKREGAAEQSRQDLETLQKGHEVAYAAAREEIVHANEALWEQARAQGADVPRDAPAAATLEDALHRVLALREVMESAAAAATARESRAQTLLADAAQRAREINSLEGKVRDEEGRLAALKAEIVNAKKALSVVDAALTRMPYDVVDDFTRSDAFENYERAVKALKRFTD
jgi:chromosome segregation ATPase